MSKDINAMMEEALDKAKELVTGDRQKDYGTPQESFRCIAALWSAYLGIEVTAEQVAIMQALLKIGRSAGGRKTPNTYYDLLGYGAIAYALRPHADAPEEQGQNLFAGMTWKPWPERETASNPLTDNKQTIVTPGLVAAVVADAFGVAKEPGEEFRKWLRAVPISTPKTEQLWLAWQDGMRYGQKNAFQVPDGWQLVPQKPTKEMLEKLREENSNG